MNSRMILLLFLLLSFSLYSGAQDTLTLLNGKTIIAKNVEVGGYSISYEGLKEGSKRKRLAAETVFSIKHADGTEQIIYEADTLEEGEFNAEQMRMFIRGEQDATKYYRNNVNKLAAFAFGGGASYFAFYGILGPAIYTTVVGSFSPVMEKQRVSNPALIQVDEYREGYERKVRDKKIVSSILYGLVGFATGVAVFSIATHN